MKIFHSPFQITNRPMIGWWRPARRWAWRSTTPSPGSSSPAPLSTWTTAFSDSSTIKQLRICQFAGQFRWRGPSLLPSRPKGGGRNGDFTTSKRRERSPVSISQGTSLQTEGCLLTSQSNTLIIHISQSNTSPILLKKVRQSCLVLGWTCLKRAPTNYPLKK